MDGFYAAFGMIAPEMEVLFGVCGLLVNICDNLALLIFNKHV